MSFDEPIFIFLFLPLTLLAYNLVPAKWGTVRGALLVLASLVFYAWGGGASVLFIVVATLGNMLVAWVIEYSGQSRPGRRWLAAGVTANLLVLAVCKYARFAVENVNAGLTAAGISALPVPRIVSPPGISFFTFVAIAYLVEVWRGNAKAMKCPVGAGLHMMFFSRVLAGPIVKPQDVAGDIAAPRGPTREQMAAAVRRFIIGLGKKVLIANAVGAVADRIFAVPVSELRPAVAWLGAACYTVQIYFDFSGYTDMAIAAGGMFGFRFPENFNYPYIATTVRDFWRRWHMSLSSWLRDYLYIPLGGSRCPPWRVSLNLAIVFLVCGLWHGARWTFVVWGAFQGVFLILEREGLEKRLETSWRPLRHAYLLLVLVVSWVVFRCDTLPQAIGYLAALTGLTTPTGVQDGVLAYLNPPLVVALAAGVIGAMPVIPAIKQRWGGDMSAGLGGRTRVWAGVELATLTLVLVLSLLTVAASTYSPFIYSQF